MPSALSSFNSDNDWTVPEYVDLVRLVATGESGADGSVDPGGEWDSDTAAGANGGKAVGELSVSPGQVLYVRFPDGGSGGSASTSDAHSNGGGGGNGADVRTGSDTDGNQVISAGGGGGGGAATATGDAVAGTGGTGSGGDGQSVSTSGTSASGGSGGGQSSPPGDNGSGSSSFHTVAAGGGGGGGLNGGSGGGTGIFSDPDSGQASAGGGGAGTATTSGVSNASTSDGVSSSSGINIEYSDRITNLSADVSTEDEVILSWTEPLDVSSYNVYRAEATGNGPADYTQIASGVSTGTTSYTDTNLEDGEQYYYRVENVNSFDNRLSNESAPITLLPEATNLSGTFDGTDVNLSWTNNDDSADGGIEVERSTDDGSTWTSIASGLAVSTESYTDTTIAPGETALYRINRNTDHTTATSATEEVIVAGSVVIGDANGVRTTNSGVVSTE